MGDVPRAVAEEIKFRQRQRGLTQRQLSELVGLSQGQLANALRGHDPISARAVNRLRDVLLTAPDQQELRVSHSEEERHCHEICNGSVSRTASAST